MLFRTFAVDIKLGANVSISTLVSEAHQTLAKLHGLETEGSAVAIGLVESFLEVLEEEPNPVGLGKAAHSLSWHLADQIEPLPYSLEISELSSHARRLSKA